MNRRHRSPSRSPRPHDGERGAALILALAVMVAIGGVLGGLSYFMSTSSRSSNSLQNSRNQLYAADGAIESAIRAVQSSSNGLLGNTCPGAVPATFQANGVTVHVTCSGQPSSSLQGTQVVIQRNVVFTACDTAGCPPGSEIFISAKVNFPTNAAGVITGAFVQSWSVRP
jgi:uncharacterized protein (UPF0333 family)